jgi:hypothetical protein
MKSPARRYGKEEHMKLNRRLFSRGVVALALLITVLITSPAWAQQIDVNSSVVGRRTFCASGRGAHSCSSPS